MATTARRKEKKNGFMRMAQLRCIVPFMPHFVDLRRFPLKAKSRQPHKPICDRELGLLEPLFTPRLAVAPAITTTFLAANTGKL